MPDPERVQQYARGYTSMYRVAHTGRGSAFTIAAAIDTLFWERVAAVGRQEAEAEKLAGLAIARATCEAEGVTTW